MSYTAMGARIRARRTACGLTLRQLAAKADVTETTLGRLELGKLSEPKLPTLEAIAAALGVRLGWVVSGGEVGPAPSYLELDEMLLTTLGSNATADEIEHLRHICAHPPYGRRVTSAYLQTVLVAMRGTIPVSSVGAVSELNEQLDRGNMPENTRKK